MPIAPIRLDPIELAQQQRLLGGVPAPAPLDLRQTLQRLLDRLLLDLLTQPGEGHSSGVDWHANIMRMGVLHSMSTHRSGSGNGR
jgi:hypothetical protein